MKKNNLLNDIYYCKDFVKTYLRPGEEIFEFSYNEGLDYLYSLSIKKPISKIGETSIKSEYFDLETPHSYGGYISSTNCKFFLTRAFSELKLKCIKENIIAEFISFHPSNEFLVNNPTFFDFFSKDREIVFIDLRDSRADRINKYSPTTRNIIKKSTNILNVTESSDLNSFFNIYEFTMKKNNATNHYFFPKKYFESIFALRDVKLFSVNYKNEIIAMAFIVFGNSIAHYHLSANSELSLKMHGNYYLIDFLSDYIKDNYPDITFFNLGGGRSNLESDLLLKFKSKFSHIRKFFYIAGNVYNSYVYDSYISKFNQLYPKQKDDLFFLKYRSQSCE